MQVFVRAVELGSISSAAEDLNISSQLAGKQVRALEQSLGIKLLNRTTRRQSLTDVGTVFYERARTILAEMEAAEALVEDARALPRGRLRISAPITFGSRALAPALVEYLRLYPDVTTDLSLSNRTVDLVEEGFDVVFRTGELPDSSLVARRLAPYRMALCAAPAYLKAAGTPHKPEDLPRHECLVFSHTALRTQWEFDGVEGRVSIAINGRFSTDSSEALRAAAVAGQGLILQPRELLNEDMAAGRLVRLMPDYEPVARALHLLYTADRRMTPKLRSFLDFAVEKFGPVNGQGTVRPTLP